MMALGKAFLEFLKSVVEAYGPATVFWILFAGMLLAAAVMALLEWRAQRAHDRLTGAFSDTIAELRARIAEQGTGIAEQRTELADLRAKHDALLKENGALQARLAASDSEIAWRDRQLDAVRAAFEREPEPRRQTGADGPEPGKGAGDRKALPQGAPNLAVPPTPPEAKQPIEPGDRHV
jgi:hypothetical protein